MVQAPEVQAAASAAQNARTNRSAQQVREIRERFLQEYEHNPVLFEEEDVQRVRESEWFVKRFYLSKGRNVEEALKMLLRTTKWRKSLDIGIMRDWMFPVEFYKIGGLFPYEKDKNGNVMVYMRVCMHRKIVELEEFEKKFLLRVFDKVESLTDGNGFAVVFDLTNAGYSNVDIEFLRFLIDCTTYYPVGLKYILVTNLPWILNAVRKTVMLILPQALLGLLKFASGDEIFEYIDRENVPDFLNGTCKRNYRQVPFGSKPVAELVEEFGFTKEDVDRLMPPFKTSLALADKELAKNEYYDLKNYFDMPSQYDLDNYTEINRLKLEWQQGRISEADYRSVLDEKFRRNSGAVLTNCDKAELMQPDILTDISNQPADSIQQNLFNVIKVTPDKTLYFEYNAAENNYSVDVFVENNTNQYVAYKVQSNNPKDYQVSPRIGIILPKKIVYFTIKTVSDDVSQLYKDKFLILALQVTKSEMRFDEFTELWNKPAQKVESVRLQSCLLPPVDTGDPDDDYEADEYREPDAYIARNQYPRSRESEYLQAQVQLLVKKCELMQKRQTRTNWLILLLIFIVGIFAGMFYKSAFVTT